MFHIELRQPPHSLHRFNLTERELAGTVLEPWVRGAQFELGERIWDPSTSSIAVLEGPEIPIGSLTMGRGWAVAQRKTSDVTAEVIAKMRATLTEDASAAAEAALASGGPIGAAAGAAPTPAQIAPTDAAVLADALGLELLRGLGSTPMSLPAVWKAAAERYPQMPAGAALEIARAAITSLLGAQLVRVSSAGEQGGGEMQQAEVEQALAAIDAWSTESGPNALWIRRG
jgi:hypothetical protein